jgi:hypothetical protein
MIFSRFGFGKTSNRRFNFVPRYYDADKEEFNKRVEMARREVGGEQSTDDLKERIRQGFSYRNKAYNNVYNHEHKKSLLRRMLIAVILGAIFYVLLSSDLLDKFIGAFSF